MSRLKNSHNFLPILNEWEKYFYHPDEGLGTTYERFILHSLFEVIDKNFDIHIVVEAPIFGMTGISGINSIWWAKKGKKVYLIDDNLSRLQMVKIIWKDLNCPVCTMVNRSGNLNFKSNSVDLMWNFAALWFITDLFDFARQARSMAKKIIFICVPNDRGIGFLLRKSLVGVPSRLNLKNLNPDRIFQAFSRDGWSLWQEGLFDIPPWPDIPMKKEDLIKKVGLGFLQKIRRRECNVGQKDNRLSILDYYRDKNSEIAQRIMRFAFLENSPRLCKLLWGHHRYFIFQKKE